MNKAILLMVESISNERDLDKEIIFQAVEAALASVAAKRFEEDALARVVINRETGEYETFRVWAVIPDDVEIELPAQQIALLEAKKIDENLEVGDVIEEELESEAFGRIAAQQAKQVILQKVREAERNKVIEQFQQRLNSMMIGTVKRFSRESVILDMGDNAEALLAREHMLPREAFQLNDRARVYLFAVSDAKKGPQLLVTRTVPEFLVELFRIEVPEIGEDVIEIKAAARDPGVRAKIAVKTNDGRIDPVGACVGMRGARVQAVSNELEGERIDIILWDDNPAQLVINAMAPAEVQSIVVDEENHSMDIIVAEEQLSQAIGRGGQNIRLASDLTGWTLNVMTEEQSAEKQQSESSGIKEVFMEALDVDEDIADVLVQAGLTSLEEVAYVPAEELAVIEGFDADIAEELQRRASDMLLTAEIAHQTEIDEREPAKDLLEVEGMSSELAKELADNNIITRDDLAELAIDELQEIIKMDEKEAGELIMKARAHWFD